MVRSYEIYHLSLLEVTYIIIMVASKQKNYTGAVVDIDFGHGEVEQCADAVIFLRALWLWTTKQYDKIHF